MHLLEISIDSSGFPSVETYPFMIPAIQGETTVEFSSPVTFFIGENGSGKSTLLRAIARRCGIYLWQGIQRPRYETNPLSEELYRFVALRWSDGSVPGSFFGSDIFANFARILDEWATMDPGIMKYYGGESLVSKSHGQCNMAYFTHRFSRRGIYFLDEPETALSPRSQLELLELLKTFSATQDVQFLIATHSPILLSMPEARIYRFQDEGINPVSYTDTEYYTIYRAFFDSLSYS